MTKQFWGYNSREEAETYWGKFDPDEISVDTVSVCTRGKRCVGSIDGITYKYADGSFDTGTEIDQYTVIIENNKIRW